MKFFKNRRIVEIEIYIVRLHIAKCKLEYVPFVGLDSKVIRAKIIFPLNYSMLQIICETMYKTNLNKNRPFCSALGSMTFQHF